MRAANFVDSDRLTALAASGERPSLLRSISLELSRFRITTAAIKAAHAAAPAAYMTKENLDVAVCELDRLLSPPSLAALSSDSSATSLSVELSVLLVELLPLELVQEHCGSL